MITGTTGITGGTEGSLAGVRVIDLSTHGGRFATKVLAEMGADVIKIAGRGAAGAPMVDPRVAARGGLLDWSFDGGKRQLAVDLDQADGQAALRRLAARADVIIDDATPGWLEARGLDRRRLAADNPALVHVSLSAFGATGPRAGWRSSDLVSAALGGVCSITGTLDAPLNSWGRLNDGFGGFVAAISALAGLYDARRGGRGQHVDVSQHEVVTATIENLFVQYFYADLLDLPKLAPRQGSLHWLRVYDVVPARTGTVMITPTPSPEPLIDWMVEDGFEEAIGFAGLGIEEILDRRDELMELIRRFCLRHDAGHLFTEAQSRRIAFGEVQSVPQVAANPQFAFRGFIQAVEWDGPEVLAPGRPAQLSATPHRAPRPPAAGPSPLEALLDAWPERPMVAVAPVEAPVESPVVEPPVVEPPVAASAGAATSTGSGKPLDGVRIADFTWVLAGPFCTRLLGDLGADVVKIQNEERATLVNRPHYPYYPVWNRSKRSALLDMKHPDALGVARRIIEASDVLVENYSAGVLARWGLDWDTVHAWNPRLIYVTMSGCGHEGPWSKVLSYAPTVHALCGLTYLTNPADRRDIGCGFSLNDHAAGFVAAVEILGALEARRHSGQGQRIDLAQLEVGSWLIGPAIVDHLANGRVTEPDGNGDPFEDLVPNELYRAADGRWLAVSVTDDAQWPGLCRTISRPDLADDAALATGAGRRAQRPRVDAAVAEWCATHDAQAAMERLQHAAVPAGVVQDAADLFADPQHAARGFWHRFEDHPLYGPRPFDRFPAQWSGTDLEPYRRAPYFGEHNFEIYGELCGLSDEEIARGIADGVFQ